MRVGTHPALTEDHDAKFQHHHTTRATATVVALFTSVSLVFGQTKIVAPENKYSVQEDVKAGREAAGQVEEQLPILRDDGVDDYVERVGARLVESIPSEFRHSEFRYTFDVVNISDINAFALPGGPMFVNRGMLEAAKNEGEVAGVLAHEISHVALRHGTAQAGKATPYQVGSILGQIAGAIIGGVAGQAVSLGSQFGFGTAFLKYGREYERQADLLGAQIMARAGYDPRDMANMFQTIQAKGGNGGPEWMSSHPNPSNRYQAINQEAAQLRVTNPTSQHAGVHAGEVAAAADGAGADHRTGGAEWQSQDDGGGRANGRLSRGPGRCAFGPLPDIRRRESLSHCGSVELARAPGEQLCDVRSARRLRRLSRTERFHARLAGWPRRQQRAQPSQRRPIN